MSVTMAQIAREAGVSQATVSYVISGRKSKGCISDATRKLVLDTARRSGYAPNRMARSLATGRSHLVVLWTFGIADAYYANSMGHLLEMLRKTGYEASFFETQDDFAGRNVLRDTASLPADGIIALDSPNCIEAYRRAQGRHAKPLVSIGATLDGGIDCVRLDLSAGAKEATCHLIVTGRRRIAYLAPSNHMSAKDLRFSAYTATMKIAGLKPEYISMPSPRPGIQRADARREIQAYVKQRGCPDALFCYNDEGAIGAYRGLRDLSICIPDDIAVVGCNGDLDTEYLDVPLTTLIFPVEEMCAKAWSFLQKRMTNPGLPRQEAVLLPKLEVRESSMKREDKKSVCPA